MNLLAHLYLAERSATSAAGQILGDLVKGRLENRFDARTRTGIQLHRRIDAFSDGHAVHLALRRRFAPPLRRYAGIVVDIGLDHSLARAWPDISDTPLGDFAWRAQRRVQAEWPESAPMPRERLDGLAGILTGYRSASGVARALAAVARRMTRANPLAEALPAMLSHREAFDAHLPALLTDLDAMVRAEAAS